MLSLSIYFFVSIFNSQINQFLSLIFIIIHKLQKIIQNNIAEMKTACYNSIDTIKSDGYILSNFKIALLF